MSYILDALRRAEAERERGSVPSIHAQPAFAAVPPADAPAKSRLWIGVTAIGVLLVVVAAILFYLLLGRSGPVIEAAAPVASPPAIAPATAAATPAPPVPATPATVVAAAPQVQTAPPPARKPRPVPAAATPASAAASLPAAPAKTEERVYAVNELPDDVRRQLPALSVGGSMYSPVAANRLVIINGQVLHEGERITPELVVQQIKLKAAVLVFRSYRFAIAF